MLRSFKSALLPVLCIGTLTACSNTGGLPGTNLTTSSIDAQKVAKKPAVDPACVTLVSKIDSLRKDGITDRVAKAGAGKSKTVSVYRASLARMAELDRANADYQRRCGTLKPATASLTHTPAPSPAKTAAVNTVKKDTKKAASKVVKTKAAAKVATTAAPVTTAAKEAAAEAAKKAALEAAKKEAIKAASANATTQ